MSKRCEACSYCFIEPSDMNFTCGHPDAGPVGLYTHHAVKEGGHCGPNLSKFEQHPLRNEDGTIKEVH